MANIDLALNVSDGIALEDNTTGLVADTILLTQGSIDPTLGLGFDAPLGSLFLRRDGAIYSKTTAPDTGWVLNTATGSTQDLFETFNGDTGTITATSPTDSLTIAGGSGITTSLVGSTLTINSLVSSDELVKVTSDDTTADYLFNKLLAGTLISISETNPGGNEKVTISTTAEINTASNLGAGTGVFGTKSGSNLQFKSLIGGTGISLSNNVNEITITNSSPNIDQNLFETFTADSGSTSANTTTDTLNIVGGTGITTAISGDTLTITKGNNNGFDSIEVSGQSTVVADSETDTLTLVAGTGMTITTNDTTDTITFISSSSGDPDQNLFETFTADTGTTTADIITDTLNVVGGTGITTAISGDTLTITNSQQLLVSSLAAVSVSRTTTIALPTTYANITWDTTDVETTPSVIEHNNTNTERLDIKDDGLYLVSFSLSINADAGEETFDIRVMINDTTQVPGSLRTISEDDEINAVSCTVPVVLTNGDYLTLQHQASGTGNVFSLGHNFNATRLQGTKGEPGADGAPGSGTTLIIKEEGVNLANTPHSALNFIGSDITAVDAGSGVADVTVAPIFGSQFHQAESLGVSTTTSTTFQNKITMVTVSVPAGTYRIGVSYGWNHDGTGNDFEARLQQNTTNLGEIHKQEPQDSAGTFSTTGTSQRFLASRTYYRTLTAGVYTYELDFRTDTGGAESSIWDANIEFWRVS